MTCISYFNPGIFKISPGSVNIELLFTPESLRSEISLLNIPTLKVNLPDQVEAGIFLLKSLTLLKNTKVLYLICPGRKVADKEYLMAIASLFNLESIFIEMFCNVCYNLNNCPFFSCVNSYISKSLNIIKWKFRGFYNVTTKDYEMIVEKCPLLQNFYLSFSEPQQLPYSAILSVKTLKSLSLFYQTFSDIEFSKKLVQFTDLENLRFFYQSYSFPIGPETCKSIISLPKLRSLTIQRSGNYQPDICVDILCKAENLQCLFLGRAFNECERIPTDELAGAFLSKLLSQESISLVNLQSLSTLGCATTSYQETLEILEKLLYVITYRFPVLKMLRLSFEIKNASPHLRIDTQKWLQDLQTITQSRPEWKVNQACGSGQLLACEFLRYENHINYLKECRIILSAYIDKCESNIKSFLSLLPTDILKELNLFLAAANMIDLPTSEIREVFDLLLKNKPREGFIITQIGSYSEHFGILKPPFSYSLECADKDVYKWIQQSINHKHSFFESNFCN